MKKSLILALAIALTPVLLGAVSEALASTPEPTIRAARTNHHYDGPISTPTLVDTIDLSPLSVVDPVGLTYDWERDALWIGQYTDSAVYAIQKTSPCTKVDSFDLGTGTPSHHWGIAYGGNDTLYIADNDGNIYRIDMQTGQGTVYRQGIGYTQGVGFNPVDEVIYVSDNNVVQCAWASPPDTGPWHAWNAPPGTYPQDMSGACSSTNTLDYLFHNEWFSSPGHFYQYSVTNGIPNTTPDSVWEYDPGQSNMSEGGCAFDGQYVYILDASPQRVWVYDVGITPYTPSHDVATFRILWPGVDVKPDTTGNPSARFRNFGSNQETFDVYFRIDSAGVNVYNQTANMTLASGGDTILNFAPWQCGITTGLVYDVSAYTVLAGDEKPRNDTLTQQTLVNPCYWEILASLPQSSIGHELATLNDGRIMAFGLVVSAQAVDTTYIYDIAANAWSQGPDNPYGSGAFGIAYGVNGKYYRIGGTDAWPTPVNRVDIYEPLSATWAAGAACPIANMLMIGGVYKDSVIFMFGGGTPSTVRTDVYYYDIFDDSWTQSTSFPAPGRHGIAGGVIDSFAIITAGETTDSLLVSYIVGTINPSSLTINWGTPKSLPEAFMGRYRPSSNVDKWNKEFWVSCGGTHVSGLRLNDIWSYSPYTDTWTNWNKPKNAATSNITPGVVAMTAAGDLGYFICGGLGAGGVIPDHEVFHIVKDSIVPGIVEQIGSEKPHSFGFAPNIVNPVKGYAAVSYTTTRQGRVSLKVYDTSGRLIKTLVDRTLEPGGNKTVFWTLKDDSGRDVSNGIYFLRLKAEDKIASHKLVLVR